MGWLLLPTVQQVSPGPIALAAQVHCRAMCQAPMHIPSIDHLDDALHGAMKGHWVGVAQHTLVNVHWPKAGHHRMAILLQCQCCTKAHHRWGTDRVRGVSVPQGPLDTPPLPSPL